MRPYMQSGAWKKLARDYWPMMDSIQFDSDIADLKDLWRDAGNNPEKYYALQLLWYDSALSKDPQVVGATVFTVGDTGQWSDWNISGTNVVQYFIDGVKEPQMQRYKPQIGDLAYIALEYVKLVDENADMVGDAREGDVGQVISGPQTIKNAVRWQLDFGNNRIGWVTETFLENVNAIKPDADYAIVGQIRVPADLGGFPLYTQLEPELVGYSGGEHWSGLNSSMGLFNIRRVKFVNNQWYFYIDQDGKGFFSGSAWVPQTAGQGSNQIVLEVYGNIKLEWESNNHCILENGEEFKDTR